MSRHRAERARWGWPALVAATAIALSIALFAVACTAEEPQRRARSDTRWTAPLTPPAPGTPGRQPSARTPLAANPLGLKWNWSQQATLEFARQTTGGATFFETEWCEVEPSPGERSWERIDRVVERSQALGYELLLKIRTGRCWATSQGLLDGLRDPFENRRKTPSAPPEDLDAYRGYVRAFVERYSAMGVHLYGIENEVDTANFWTGSFEEYTTLVRTAGEVIREVDPQARVLDAGVSSTSYGVAIAGDLLDAGREEEAVSFYSAFYARRQDGDASRFPRVSDVAGLREVLTSDMAQRSRGAFAATFDLASSGALDVYQLHYYEPWTLLDPVLDWVARNVPDDLPIEGWEVGVAWPGPSYSPEAQASETGKLLATLLARGVPRAVYLPLAFTPEGGRQEVFRGLVTPDGRELPAASAYRSVLAASSGATAARPLAVDGLSGVAFDREGTTAAVLWADEPGRLAVDEESGAEAAGLAGGPVTWSEDGLPVGPEPIVVTLPAAIDDALAALGPLVSAG